MTTEQYVIQIQVEANGVKVGWLAKSFQVTHDDPVPTYVPPKRIQVVMTNGDSFNSIVAVYNQYETDAIFSYDDTEKTVNCAGAFTGSWPIN